MLDLAIAVYVGFVFGFACRYITGPRASDHAALGALAAAVLAEQSEAP